MKVFAFCLIAFLAFSSVQSASFQFRSGREVLIPIEEAVRADEFVAELKKEATEQLAIEEAVPVVLEEIVVPVETLRNVEPIVAVQEPVAVEAAAVADQELIVPVSALREAAVEVVAVPEAEIPQAVAAEEVIVAKSAEDVNQIVAEKIAETVAEVAHSDEAVVPADAVLRQAAAAAANDDDATSRPTLLQVAQNTISNLIANNPITNVLNAIRNPASPASGDPVIEDVQPAASATPVASAPAVSASVATNTDGAAAATPASSGSPAAPQRPTFVQSVQNGVTNFQHQLQTALNNVQTSAANVVNGSNRPNIIQSIQSALNRPIQAIFRPNANQASASDEHDAVTVDDAVAPAVSADVAAPAPAISAAVIIAEDTKTPVVSIVKDGIEIVSDKVDEIKPADA